MEVNEDAMTQGFLDLVADAPQVLGTFAGHTHMRSEDPIGRNWQFVTGAGNDRQWRVVGILARPRRIPVQERRPRGDSIPLISKIGVIHQKDASSLRISLDE